MKLALIPPNCMKSSVLDGTIHLVLPNQLKTWDKDFVLSVTQSDYTILDNGAAEGKTASWNQLSTLCNLVDVDEVVLPDKLGDAEFSIETARQAGKMPRLCNSDGTPIKYMAVAQGQTLAEIMKCVYAYHTMDHIDVIGLPRIMNQSFSPRSRYRFCESFAADTGLNKPLHCLGAYYPYAEEVKDLAELGTVRSMDTSMAWVFGVASRYVHRQYPKRGLQRPNGYFDLDLTLDQKEVCDYNVRTILQWAKAPRS